MLNNLEKLKNKTHQRGFTIIEVMIVLAIAGLIILIVLLAVPALQRNARNTAIKNDASAVAAGINEFKSNNDGTSPTNAAGTGVITISGAGAGVANVTTKIQGNTQVITGGAPAAGVIEVTLTNSVCPNSGLTAGPRTGTVNYLIETSGGGGTTARCIDV